MNDPSTTRDNHIDLEAHYCAGRRCAGCAAKDETISALVAANTELKDQIAHLYPQIGIMPEFFRHPLAASVAEVNPALDLSPPQK